MIDYEKRIAEQEAWVCYMRASLASNEAWVRWEEVRGGSVEAARTTLALSRETLRSSETMLSEMRRMAEEQESAPVVEPLGSTVLCDTGTHSIPDGMECPHCGANPKCAGCPGKEE